MKVRFTFHYYCLLYLIMETDLRFQVASYGTKVVDAVNQFVTHNISSLPIVDKQGKCVDVFCKFDMIQMAASHTFSDLEVTVAQALEERKQYFEGVFTCRGLSLEK